MRFTASPPDRFTSGVLDLTGATLAGFAIAHLVIAARIGFTTTTAVAIAAVAVLLAITLLLAQPRWIELDHHWLIRGRGPLRSRRYLSAIYFAGIENDEHGYHLAICLRGGERLRVGRGFAYEDLHQLRARLR